MKLSTLQTFFSVKVLLLLLIIVLTPFTYVQVKSYLANSVLHDQEGTFADFTKAKDWGNLYRGSETGHMFMLKTKLVDDVLYYQVKCYYEMSKQRFIEFRDKDGFHLFNIDLWRGDKLQRKNKKGESYIEISGNSHIRVKKSLYSLFHRASISGR